MSDIPSELFTNILSLLPVQSLLRFRSTSKSLRTLIDSHNFINLHLNNSLNLNIILRCDSKLYKIDFPNLTTCAQLDCPPQFYTAMDLALIGSCNGLLSIFTSEVNFITFWNPNTRKHSVIPESPILHRSSDSIIRYFIKVVHGFGYDPFTGDYKFIKILTFVDSQDILFDTELRLFSSITNSWKVFPNSMPYVVRDSMVVGVYVNHSLHWVMKPNLHSPHLIVIAINLTLENFNEVPLPEIGRERINICIAVLGGCLSLGVTYFKTSTTVIDVWVMKEYGSRDSWCKLFTLMQPEGECFSCFRPLGRSSDGKILLETYSRKLCWYDPKTKQVSYVTGIPDYDEAMVCTETLVSPPSLPTNQHMSRCESISKTRDRRTDTSGAKTGCSNCLWFWK